MVVALVALPLVGGGILVATAMPAWMKQMQAQVETAGRTGGAGAMTAEDSMAAHAGLDSLGRYMEARRAAGSQLPRNDEALYALYRAELDRDAPLDPFDGKRYGYQMDEDGKSYLLWSTASMAAPAPMTTSTGVLTRGSRRGANQTARLPL